MVARRIRVGTAAAGATFPTLTNLIGRWNALPANVTQSGTVTAAVNLANPGTNNLSNNATVPYNATSAYNSKPAFDFAAANSACLKTASFPIGTANNVSVFFVGRMTGSTAAYGRAMAYGVGAVNDFNGAGSAAFITRDATNNGITTFSNVYNQPSPGAFSISLNTNYRIGLVINGGGSGLVELFRNNSSLGTASVPLNFSNNGTFIIGNEYNSGVGTASPWDGPICEVVVCNAALDSTERGNLDTYFTDQWGS